MIRRVYAVAMGLLCVLSVLTDFAAGAVWFTIAWASFAAAVAGPAVLRLRHRLPWQLVAVTIACRAASHYLGFYVDETSTFSLEDALLLLGYVPAVGAFVLLADRRGPGRDWAGLLDAVIVAVSAGLVVWVYVVGPEALRTEVSWGYRLSAIVPPLADLLLLALLARLVFPLAGSSRSAWLLMAGGFGLLASDTVTALVEVGRVDIGDYWTPGGPAHLGWILFYVTWGGAALLLPTGGGPALPARRDQRGIEAPRIVVLAFAAMINPAVVFIEIARGNGPDVRFTPLLSALVFMAVLTRLSLLLADHRRILDRETTLRSSGALLIAADSLPEIGATLVSTATTLFGPNGHYQVTAVVADGGDVQVTTAHGGDEAGSPGIDAAAWQAFLARWRPPDPDNPQHAWQTGADALPTRTGAPIGALDRSGGVLIVPLGLETGPDGIGTAGALVASSRPEQLAVLGGPLEILAGQASLAMSRIRLSGELARQAGERYFRSLVNNASDAILVVDPDRSVTYASPAAAKMFPDAGRAAVRLADVIGAANAAQLDALLAGPATGVAGAAHWTLPGGGAEVEVRCDDLRTDPEIGGAVVTLRDVTETRRLERELRRLAYHDTVTDLGNQAAFGEQLTEALAGLAPSGSLAVFLIDVDDFAECNDVYGRAAGDEILAMVGLRLRALTRDCDNLARLDADRFAVAVAGLSRPSELDTFARRVTEAFREPFVLARVRIGLTVSGGIATSDFTHDAEKLMSDVQLALHAAKRDGPRTWRTYTPGLRAASDELAALRAGIDRALEAEEFVVHYQPVVRQRDGVTVSFEALVRWRRPDGRLIAPDRFIPLAERTGQILQLGRWVGRTALADTVGWNRRRAALGRPPLKINVNVSVHQLQDPGCVERATALITEGGVDPALIILEVTESALIGASGFAVDVLDRMRQFGVGVAMDDFGTGYSSLSRLAELPITCLKLDKSFIAGVGAEPRATALTDGIIGIATRLGLPTVAEGVENEVQRARLDAAGCDFGQGYLFSRPMPAAEVEAWLEDEHRRGVL